MGRLIVNADDFGLTRGVNRAIEELHQSGLLKNATLMAGETACEDAVEIALANPGLAVGCHVTLLNGTAILPAERIGSLIERRHGRLYDRLLDFLPRLYAGRIDPVEIEAETEAQIDLLQSRGVVVTHIDTHKHIHSFPPVLRAVLRAARRAGVRAVRNPFEPEWSLRATASASRMRRLKVRLQRLLRRSFVRIVAEEGFATTDGVIGVSATGVLDEQTIRSLLERMPAGTWEMVTHPGYCDADLAQARTVLLASREVEREAYAALEEFPAELQVTFAALGA